MISDYRYTTSADRTKVYAMITKWPGETITLASVSPSANLRVQMLGAEGTLTYNETEEGIQISIPRPDHIQSKWVWTLLFTL